MNQIESLFLLIFLFSLIIGFTIASVIGCDCFCKCSKCCKKNKYIEIA